MSLGVFLLEWVLYHFPGFENMRWQTFTGVQSLVGKLNILQYKGHSVKIHLTPNANSTKTEKPCLKGDSAHFASLSKLLTGVWM